MKVFAGCSMLDNEVECFSGMLVNEKMACIEELF